MGRELEGKVAVVTGAASGIGLASAEAMLAAGARVVMVDRDEVALKALRAKHGDGMLPLVIDLIGASRSRFSRRPAAIGATPPPMAQFLPLWSLHAALMGGKRSLPSPQSGDRHAPTTSGAIGRFSKRTFRQTLSGPICLLA